MQDMEMMNETTNMVVSEKMKTNMLGTAKWLKFLTVLSTVGVVVLVLAGIALCVGCLTGDDTCTNGITNGITKSMGVIYILLALVYIYPLKKCFCIVKNIRKACSQDTQSDIEQVTEDTYRVMRFFGILSIIVLCTYVLVGLAIGVMAGIAAA